MREFKFRAWDRELQKMLDVESLEFSQWWVQCKKPENSKQSNSRLFYGERNSFKNEETDRHILMQYSNHKDDNLKEIYENDILKYECCNCGENHTVVVGNNNFEVDVCGRDYDYTTLEWSGILDSGNLKVIGNIYENPELLEGE